MCIGTTQTKPAMNKERKLVSYSSLCDQTLLALQTTYPNGIKEHLLKINTGKRKPLYAIRVETDTAVYLVKIDPAKIESEGRPSVDNDEVAKRLDRKTKR